MPNNKPAGIDTIKKARKGLTFAQVINITKDAMHNTRMRKVMIKVYNEIDIARMTFALM
jgi:hypothetical protein